MNQLLCTLLNLLSGSSAITTTYASQLSSPGQIAINPISVPSFSAPSSAGSPSLLILPANKKRKQWILTNVGIVAVMVKFNAPPNSQGTDWTYLLNASANQGDGSGGVVIDQMWKGAVYVQAVSGTGLVNITELV